ncbi:MAG: riboflavin biosynthesis protein RibF, partial [Ureaplasma sp.]|nr:riboflavin biosynthesis protein RibF [Ureaplasma sp.]
MNKIEKMIADNPEFSLERLVIGWFDGLHIGHLKLFNENLANTSVITFINHPTKKQNALYTDEERIEQLISIGVKDVYVYDLKQNLSADDFVSNILLKLNPKTVVVGENFNFGCDKKGVDFLSNHLKLEVIPKYMNYSSSAIRNLILSGNFEAANEMLVWPYHRKGYVEHGDGNGDGLGTKTANIEINNSLIKIPDGVYATKTKLNDNHKYKS